MDRDALVEALGRAIYEARTKGLQNVWPWDDAGLDEEHPGLRASILREARAALAVAEPAVRADEAIMSAVSCEASAFNARAINDHSVGAVFAEVFETQAKRFREHAEAIRTGGTP